MKCNGLNYFQGTCTYLSLRKTCSFVDILSETLVLWTLNFVVLTNSINCPTGNLYFVSL